MNILKKFVFIAFCIVCSYGSICAQEVDYLEQAYELYGLGKYEQAQNALNVYSELTGAEDKSLEEKIKYCLNCQTLAQQAESSGDYKKAKKYYEKIVAYNPKDSQSAVIILKLDALIKEQFDQTNFSINSNSKKVKKKLVNDIRDISWVLGIGSGNDCGDVFGFYTMLKFGNPSGFALEGGYSPGVISFDTWSVGLKGYWKSLYGSIHLGTTMPIYGKELESGITDSGEIIAEGSRNYGKYGFSFLIGFDKIFYKGFHLTIGVGMIFPIVSEKATMALPIWNIGIGCDLFRLLF